MPSAIPTLAAGVSDCRTTCSLYTDPAVTISFSTLLTQLAIPKYFSLSFQIDGVALTATNAYRSSVLDIKDSVSDVSLFSIETTETVNLRVIYGGNIIYSYGPPVNAPNLNAWTTISVTVGPEGFKIVSSADSANPLSTNAIPAIVDTTGRIYSLFVSNDYENSAGGNFRNFFMQGTLNLELFEQSGCKLIS